MPDLIFISLERWDDIWRRNQFVCASLLRRNPNLRILFIEPAKDFSHAVRTGAWQQTRGPRLREVGLGPRLLCGRPSKFLPNSQTFCRIWNERFYRYQVGKLARELGMIEPLLWINDHGAEHLVRCLNERKVIYDVTDDWTAFRQSDALTSLIKRQDAELAGKADTVIVCSPRLADLKRRLAREVALIPNGVDTDHYKLSADGVLTIPEEAKAWTQPVLGYTGTVHPDRVDVELVAALAGRLPQATLVFIGPVMLPDVDLRLLARFPNVVLTGPRPYSEIPAYVSAFDVCMTPHVVTPFTESLNPIKLWDYLAIGKPIISTPVAGFRDYPELVYLAGDAEAFAKALKLALTEDRALANRRREEAVKHTWERRVEAIECLLGLENHAPGERISALVHG